MVKVGTSGIVVNERGELLVIQRDDTRTWAAPGGLLEKGEDPLSGAAREVEEETGFKVLPVRLVGLHFLPIRPGYLQFVFRCLLRGGEARVSAESLQIGFTPVRPISLPMLAMHRQRAEMAVAHAGGPPEWGVDRLGWRERIGKVILFQGLYPAFNLMRRWRGEPLYIAPPLWRVETQVVVRDKQGAVIWLQDAAAQTWHLPGVECQDMEPPWEAAQRAARLMGSRVRLTDLSAVYTWPAAQVMRCVFTAAWEAEGTDLAAVACPMDDLPATAHPRHLQAVTDALAPRETTLFATFTTSLEPL